MLRPIFTVFYKLQGDVIYPGRLHLWYLALQNYEEFLNFEFSA